MSHPMEITAGFAYFITTADGCSRVVFVKDILEDPNLGRKILCNPKVFVGNTGRRNVFFKDGVAPETEFEPELPGGIMESAVVDWCVWPHAIPEAAL